MNRHKYLIVVLVDIPNLFIKTPKCRVRMPTMYTKNLQHYSYSAGINVYQSINNVTGNRFVFHKITFGQHKKNDEKYK